MFSIVVRIIEISLAGSRDKSSSGRLDFCAPLDECWWRLRPSNEDLVSRCRWNSWHQCWADRLLLSGTFSLHCGLSETLAWLSNLSDRPAIHPKLEPEVQNDKNYLINFLGVFSCLPLVHRIFRGCRSVRLMPILAAIQHSLCHWTSAWTFRENLRKCLYTFSTFYQNQNKHKATPLGRGTFA